MFRLIRCERGSASIEFVALAIPLFIPILIFLNHFAQQSNARNIAEDVARQSVHAYWTGSNIIEGLVNAANAARETALSLGVTEEELARMGIDTQCDRNPCWGPDVTLTIRISLKTKDGVILNGSATETSSHWAVA